MNIKSTVPRRISEKIPFSHFILIRGWDYCKVRKVQANSEQTQRTQNSTGKRTTTIQIDWQARGRKKGDWRRWTGEGGREQGDRSRGTGEGGREKVDWRRGTGERGREKGDGRIGTGEGGREKVDRRRGTGGRGPEVRGRETKGTGSKTEMNRTRPSIH